MRDVVSILAGDAPVHETRVELPIVADVSPPSTCTSRSPTGPACWPRIATVLGDHDVSVKSVVQRGDGEDAAW